MKKSVVVLLVGIVLVISAGIVSAAEQGRTYYVCNCEDDCTCSSISREPGKCKCGTEMTPMHLLAVENDTAILCRCGGECACERNKENPGQCGCGKPVKKVDIKGRHICGLSGECSHGSNGETPEKCGCGKVKKQAL